MDYRPPQQARSRRALEKVLASAEYVLATDGFEDFKMTSVAEHAGVSIGAIYRRFEGREQLLAAVKDRLLSQLEQQLDERMQQAGPGLANTIEAFTLAIADAIEAQRHTFPELLRRDTGSPLVERGRQSRAEVKRLFDKATAPCIGEVRRSDPQVALEAIERMITGALVYTATSPHLLADSDWWRTYASQLSAMANAYLLSPDPGTEAPSR